MIARSWLAASAPFVAMTLACSAPAEAQVAKNDIMIDDSAPFGVAWGSLPGPAREGFARLAMLTEVDARNIAFMEQDNIASYTLNRDGFSYDLDIFFDPDASTLSILTINAGDEAACSALESRLISGLGEGAKTVENLKDDRGDYQTNTRAWFDSNRRTQYLYTYIPANSAGREYCLVAFVDSMAGLQ